MPRQGPEVALWAVEDHCCRTCFSRVLSRAYEGATQFRCSNCGSVAEAKTAASICCCGMKSRRGTDLGIRCMANDARSPEVPAEIIAREVGK